MSTRSGRWSSSGTRRATSRSSCGSRRTPRIPRRSPLPVTPAASPTSDRRAGLGRRGGRRRQAVGSAAAAARRCRRIGPAAERRTSFETLLGVDEAVRAIVEELRARGELDETLIVYVRTTGCPWGASLVGKLCPYDECIRVPFLVRLPGVAHDRAEIVSAADLRRRIADLAGVAPETCSTA
jgi:hypothetical protein